MHTDIHVLNGIRTHDPSVPTSEVSSCLRPRGRCDRLAEDVRQEIVRDMKGSCKPKDNLTGVIKKSLRALGLYI
jgi:hypothetical protein